jgi:hypothetical protein
MLGKCTAEPLGFVARFALLRQEVKENTAQVAYLDAKRLLRDAARLGYSAT